MSEAETTEPTTAAPTGAGRGVGVHGVVVDVDFPVGQLPLIGNALLVHRDRLPPVTVEVQAQLSATTVRCIRLQWLTEIRRGLAGEFAHRNADLARVPHLTEELKGELRRWIDRAKEPP
jgi:F0F1-type ATP synthase beta subunit